MQQRTAAGRTVGSRLSMAVERGARYLDRTASTLDVDDHFTGEGTHRCQLHWHVAPEAQVEARGTRVSITSGRVPWTIECEGGSPTMITLVRGQREPLLGWFSERYGHLEPTSTIVVSTEAALPVTLRTRIAWKQR